MKMLSNTSIQKVILLHIAVMLLLSMTPTQIGASTLSLRALRSAAPSSSLSSQMLVPASSQCRTLITTQTMSEKVFSAEGTLLGVCEGKVVLNKCEGGCVSTLRPSINTITGLFKVGLYCIQLQICPQLIMLTLPFQWYLILMLPKWLLFICLICLVRVDSKSIFSNLFFFSFFTQFHLCIGMYLLPRGPYGAERGGDRHLSRQRRKCISWTVCNDQFWASGRLWLSSLFVNYSILLNSHSIFCLFRLLFPA